MAEPYIRATYNGELDRDCSDASVFTIEIETEDYWTYREIAEFVQNKVLERQKDIYDMGRFLRGEGVNT